MGGVLFIGCGRQPNQQKYRSTSYQAPSYQRSYQQPTSYTYTTRPNTYGGYNGKVTPNYNSGNAFLDGVAVANGAPYSGGGFLGGVAAANAGY